MTLRDCFQQPLKCGTGSELEKSLELSKLATQFTFTTVERSNFTR